MIILQMLRDWIASNSDILNFVVLLLGFIIAILTFVLSSVSTKKAIHEQTDNQCIRVTLLDFSALRRAHQDFQKQLAEGDRTEVLKDYLTDLERFAVGCNLDVYDVSIVNKLGGAQLVRYYNDYFKAFIEERRAASAESGKTAKAKNIYVEYEKMMKDIFKMRNIPWEKKKKGKRQKAKTK